uniref:DUF5917 domain-containing protein n=1 Tax=Syphacia muris TaxID=451379 RepID=A0A0N5AU75_9BILA
MRRWFSRLGTDAPSTLIPSVAVVSSSHNDETAAHAERFFSGTTDLLPPPPTSPDANPINWNADFASDPSSWEFLFDEQWEEVKQIIGDVDDITYEKVLKLLRLLGSMTQLLMMEMNAQPEPAIGPILDRYFTNQIMERDLKLVYFMRIINFQVGLVRIYEMVVSESHTHSHCLLVHKPLLLPLIRLLEWCRTSAEKRNFAASSIDKHFVLLLNLICTKMAEDATLLHFFFTFSEDQEVQFLVFSLLVPYLYECGDVGQLARDALLLVLSVSRKMKNVAAFISAKSNFCPVVATGLSGCFSQLPTNILQELQVDEDWHKITPSDIEAQPIIKDFHLSLLFCNAVVQVAHEYVVSQTVSFIYNGFLLPVVLPSLLQNGQEDLVSATTYYHLCLDAITEAPLIQAFLKLLIVEESPTNKKVIEVIIERISSGNKLSQVSLSLLHTVIELRCEDVMLDLIFKYLIPCSYLQSNQIYTLRNRSYINKTAKYLLSLIPECALKSSVLCSQDTLRSYIEEARQLVQLTTDSCLSTWRWAYDGVNPAPSAFSSSSDEEIVAGVNSFKRQSSLRSSFASTKNGLNRYFGGNSRRITTDSLSQRVPLPELGQSDSVKPVLFLNECESVFSEIDFNELVITPITPNPAMMSSSADYFQFAYDGVSESEVEGANYKDSLEFNEDNCLAQDKSQGIENSSTTSGDCDTDFEASRSFVLRGWGGIQDMDTFMELLGRIPVPSKSKFSLEENIALINSRIQYLDELKAENPAPEEVSDKVESICSEKEVATVIGQPIKFSSNQGIVSTLGVGPLLESLLRCLENMFDNSYFFNLQLISVLCTLASFTQPLLASYFFDPCLNVRPEIKRFLKILDSLKTKVDVFATSIEGFDVLLERGVKLLKNRVDRLDKVIFNEVKIVMFRPFGLSMRRNGAKGSLRSHSFRYFSHKAIESQQATMDQARAKQIVFAAILLSQFCQELSAILLHHCVIVPRVSSTFCLH